MQSVGLGLIGGLVSEDRCLALQEPIVVYRNTSAIEEQYNN